jgi:nicotinamide/nicotinate riboside kinase
MQKKAILIAVGGATCSGKTTLAKKLQKALPNNFIIHQDDFAPVSNIGLSSSNEC